MTIAYDSDRTTAQALAKVITDLGYKTEEAESPETAASAGRAKGVHVVLPEDAPKFLRDAFGRARRAKKPLVIDFWAEWCAPCLQLKNVSFHDADVVKLLSRVELVYVDLDKYPAIGASFSVESVPDVFLVDREGVIVDRLHNFVPPTELAERLKALLGGPVGRDAP